MEHEITLNIHYTAPKEIWDNIDKIYQSMPFWSGYDDYSIGDPEDGYEFKYWN